MYSKTQSQISVLVIDDDVQIVRLIEGVLTARFGDRLRVHAATSSTAARDWLDVNCCHIVISDIEMPDMDGLEILRHAKQRNAWTQVVFVTGRSTWDRMSEAIEQGATDYLVKPIAPDELVVVVQVLVERCTRWLQALRSTLALSSTSSPN